MAWKAGPPPLHSLGVGMTEVRAGLAGLNADRRVLGARRQMPDAVPSTKLTNNLDIPLFRRVLLFLCSGLLPALARGGAEKQFAAAVADRGSSVRSWP